MKKILFVMQLPPPIHGASIMNSTVRNSKVIRDNFKVDLIALNYAKNAESIGARTPRKLFLLLKYLLTLLWKLIFNRPHLIYFTITPYGISFLRDVVFIFLIKIFRVKLVLHLHGKGANQGYEKYKWLYNFVYSSSVYVICLAESLKNDISFFTGRIFVVNNGIAEESISSAKKNYNKADIKILYLSNFIKSKGVLDLLEAVKKLNEDNIRNFKILLIGQFRKDIKRHYLENIISSYNIQDHVEIIGPKFGEEKKKYFIESDIFVFPTYYKNEAFPLVLLEAMQFSLPVISTFEGGIPEIVTNNHTGYLVSKKSPVLLAEKISHLIKRPSLREKMGYAGKQKYEQNFTVKKFEQNLNEVFISILNN